jgi:hypothetical protein
VKRRTEHIPHPAGRADQPAADEAAPGELLARLERYEARAQSAAGPRPHASPVLDGVNATEPPVTPELALVDPELASRERERLPERPGRTIAGGEAGAAVSLEAAARPAATTAQAPAPTRRRRRRRRLLQLLAVAGMGIVTVLAIVYLRSRDPQHVSSGRPSPVTASTSVVPTQVHISTRNPTATGVAHPKQKPTTKPKPVRKPQERTRPRRATKPDSKRPPVAASGRAFAWVPVSRASYYLVEFYRGRHEILRAEPSVARLVLPPSWSFGGRRYSFTPGRYRWSVRPGFGRPARHRYGKPIVQAKLVIQRKAGG